VFLVARAPPPAAPTPEVAPFHEDRMNQRTIPKSDNEKTFVLCYVMIIKNNSTNNHDTTSQNQNLNQQPHVGTSKGEDHRDFSAAPSAKAWPKQSRSMGSNLVDVKSCTSATVLLPSNYCFSAL